MGSTLTGRDKTLIWTDFGKPKAKPKAPPGGTATAARTQVSMSLKYGKTGGGKSFSLDDNVTVKVQLDKSKSWVADWVFSEPKQFQDDLLKHEQGHYEIGALLARDMFIELMQLKGQTFSSAKAVDDAVKAAVKKHGAKKVHDKYDEKSESNHGLNAVQQVAWDGYFKKAKTNPRTPAMTAPDGAVYKVPLLDVLKAAGKNP